MSVVVKEYSCPVHGYFESTFSICPTCGTTQVKRVFLTPPAFKGDATKMKDNELRQLTMTYGMSDYSNNVNTMHDKPVIDPQAHKRLADANVLAKNVDGWESFGTAQALLSGAGISVRQPSEGEKGKVTVLKPAPINTALKGKIGKYEAISHKDGDKGLRP